MHFFCFCFCFFLSPSSGFSLFFIFFLVNTLFILRAMRSACVRVCVCVRACALCVYACALWARVFVHCAFGGDGLIVLRREKNHERRRVKKKKNSNNAHTH